MFLFDYPLSSFPMENSHKTSAISPNTYSKFQTEMQVRPDDIDMNQHVHASKYFDYVLAARFDQMERCYGMGMDKFLQQGLGWFVRNSYIDYKRPLKMAEKFLVTTWIEEVFKDSVKVRFEIVKRETHKISADGYCIYTLVNLQNGRAAKIAGEILQKYTI